MSVAAICLGVAGLPILFVGWPSTRCGAGEQRGRVAVDNRDAAEHLRLDIVGDDAYVQPLDIGALEDVALQHLRC